ncbi:MAG: hypothetical protein J6X51_03780, partial [Bacteroidales bacterium]|nr:hypothetical protein [Bacteroidales bacterium]
MYLSKIASLVKSPVQQPCHRGGDAQQRRAAEHAYVYQAVLKGGVRCDDRVVAILVRVRECDEERTARHGLAPV